MTDRTVGMNVTLSGPLFSKKVDDVVKNAIVSEALTKIADRTKRGGKGKGAKANVVTPQRQELVLEVHSTLHYPRTTGKAWDRKNIAIVKAMGPNVLRSVSRRIVSELT